MARLLNPPVIYTASSFDMSLISVASNVRVGCKGPFEPLEPCMSTTAVLALMIGMEDAIRDSFEYSLISNVSYSDISQRRAE